MTKLQEIKNIPRIFLLSALLEFACTRPLFFWLTSMLLDWLGPRLQAVSDSLCIKSTSHDWSRFLAFAKAGVRFSWKGRHIIRPWWFQDEKKITRFYSCVFRQSWARESFKTWTLKLEVSKAVRGTVRTSHSFLGAFWAWKSLERTKLLGILSNSLINYEISDRISVWRWRRWNLTLNFWRRISWMSFEFLSKNATFWRIFKEKVPFL